MKIEISDIMKAVINSDSCFMPIGNHDNLKFVIPLYRHKNAHRPKKTDKPNTTNYAIIDSDRAAEVFMYGKWFLHGNKRYAVKRIKGDLVCLHTFLTKYDYCEHRNGNGLDNTSENLRPATHGQNMRNRTHGKESGYSCVTIHRKPNGEYWRTQLTPENYKLMQIFSIQKTAPKDICHNEKIAAHAMDYAVELLGMSEWYRLNNTKHLLTEEEITMVEKKVVSQLKKHNLI